MIPKRILAAVDFEACSARVVDTAASQARAHSAHLYLLHVIQPVSGLPWDTPIVPSPGMVAVDLGNHLEVRATTGLERLKKYGGDAWIEPLVRFGHPVDVILEVAKELEVDVIVLGTHGRRGLSRLLLGSVAEAVVRRASVPVVTVREPDEAVGQVTLEVVP